LNLVNTLWVEAQSIDIPQNFKDYVGGHSIISEALINRGIRSIQEAKGFLNPKDYQPSRGMKIPDVNLAVNLIITAIDSHHRIGVWGDFDVDGQTATALLVQALVQLGGDVIYHIPIRDSESHGVGIKELGEFLAKDVKLLITCDTGITAHKSIEYATSKNVRTIITDHHELPSLLPSADAVINPRGLPPDHPLSKLSGVGCAYKLVEELLQKLGKEQHAQQYLDLVALGTIADMVELTKDNRYLVQLGIQCLRNTSRSGIKVMLEMNDLNPSLLNEEHIGFILAPRLNAIGRLSDANPVVEFLTSSDDGKIRMIASRMEGFNNQRKMLSDLVFQAGLSLIKKDPGFLNQPIIVLDHPHWPAGVLGIVASRLVNIFNKPAIMISSPPGQIARGSARSVEGMNIHELLKIHRELLINFGGHPMAAGFSLLPEIIPQFKREIMKTARKIVNNSSPVAKTRIDATLTLKELTPDLIQEMDRLSPFGPGNPALILSCKGIHVKSHNFIGRNKEHLRVSVEDNEGNSAKIIWWQGAGSLLPEGLFDLAFTAHASNFQGQKEVELEWVNARGVGIPLIDIPAKLTPITILDFRKSPDPVSELNKIVNHYDCLIWSENDPNLDMPCVDRYHITPTSLLAIWSAPPSLGDLQNAIRNASPRFIALFNENCREKEIKSFLNQLAGLVRFALSTRQGIFILGELVAATGQTEIAVQKGIEWLESKGYIRICNIIDNQYFISEESEENSPAEKLITRSLIDIFIETTAFQSFYETVSAELLINGIEE